MKRVATLDEMRRMEYHILEYIDKICKENDIKYYLTYGTLLGAIRHGGFIPWDDDIDILMYREDYKKLRIVSKKYANGFYVLKDVENDKDFSLPFPKMCDVRTTIVRERYRKCRSFGVYVDIFLLDNVPDNPKIRDLFFKAMNTSRILWEISQLKQFGRKNNPFKCIIKLLIRCFSPRVYAKLMNLVANWYNRTQCKEVGQLLSNDHKCKEGIFKPMVFGEGKLRHFEKGDFLVPDDSDFFLRDWYGDYMQLPPPEKRFPKHDVNAVFDDEEIIL